VPTDKGYRFFVDSLLKVQPLANADVAEINRELSAGSDDTKTLVAAASRLLSSVTHLAGVVTLPRAQVQAVSQVEFVGLSENRILVIMVFNDREVQNQIIQVGRHFSPDELKRAANYLTDQCRGRTLPQARQEILRQMKETREHLNDVMGSAITVAQQVFSASEGSQLEYVIAGETNLMGVAELASVERLRRLFEAFNEKRDFLHLLDQSLKAEGVQIFIGHESGFQILDDCSVVTAPYSADNEVVGVLGVIGPTRMAYERVIPIVDLTAKLLGAALNSRR
jgi:heat-inducible transcriptional repressor